MSTPNTFPMLRLQFEGHEYVLKSAYDIERDGLTAQLEDMTSKRDAAMVERDELRKATWKVAKSLTDERDEWIQKYRSLELAHDKVTRKDYIYLSETMHGRDALKARVAELELTLSGRTFDDETSYLRERIAKLKTALENCKKHCVCERFKTKGFDYSEEHKKLGKPAPGKRWLTAFDIAREALEADRTVRNDENSSGIEANLTERSDKGE